MHAVLRELSLQYRQMVNDTPDSAVAEDPTVIGAVNPDVEIEPVEPRPICILSLTKAQAQALCDEYGIQDEPDQREMQRLQKTKPGLLSALQVIHCLRLYGRP